ncbi:hypothetical protein TRFO_01266 [Tritrichomonas foetus]|uniref:Uncharacterized protein n=1 Tax=Tritrichomonas foetus TaxID=1144522 RepID=A0A1J4KBS6_9EUKA|nr:hypothetical protein TRFO_01266 [Tritrichomonas foetus]|eukprot:OHT07148.1 hypothetical protein TRFO_01266 [Tritrichomonas foetus]
MISRVVKPDETTYGYDYQRKNVRKEIGRNLSTQLTTGVHYTNTPKSLYRSDHCDTASSHVYTRPLNNKLELLKLPPEYQSTVRPNLEPPSQTSNYRQFFGTPGVCPVTKRSVTTSRGLSKQTRAEIEGTTRITHHPPGYNGHIPREYAGNRGKTVHEDRNLEDLTFQFHSSKTGYNGYVPSVNMTATPHTNLQRTSTTYRDMCDEIGFRMVD